MKKILFILALILSLSTSAQNYNPDQKYSFWSNWSIGANVELVDGPASGFDGGLGVDLQLTKRLSSHWVMRLTGSAPVIYKFDSTYNRYALAGLGVMYFPWREYFYIATDAGVGTLVDGKLHPYFTSTVSTGYRFIIKDKHIINLEIGCDFRHSTQYIPSAADHFARVGYAYSLGMTKMDRKIADERAILALTYANMSGEYDSLKSAYQKSLASYEHLQGLYISQADTIKILRDSIVYLNNVIDSMWVLIDDMENYTYAPTVVFECNSYTISRDQYSYIDDLAELVKGYSDTVQVWGFADSKTGSQEYNQKLSENRAGALKKALVKRGCDGSRITTKGMGWESKYSDSNSAANRKAILVMSPKMEDYE